MKSWPLALWLLTTAMVAEASAAMPGGRCDELAASDRHALTAQAAAQLRQRVAQYAPLTDADLHALMAHMPADRWIPLSSPRRASAVGVLVLGHGYGSDGDCQLVSALQGVSASRPVAAALGMAMTSADHIMAARGWLEANGVTEVVVIPVVSGQSLSLVRQWEHALGLRPEGSYADVPQATGAARLRWAKPLIEDEAFTAIVANLARSIVLNPAQEELVLVSHGPEAAADATADARLLAGHAEAVARSLGMAAAHTALLQDDAPAAERAQAVAGLRASVESIALRQRRAVVVAVPVTSATRWVEKLRRDLHGLDYRLVADGLVNDPLFGAWVQVQVDR